MSELENARKYDRLKNVLNQSGWKDMEAIIEEEYLKALDKLLIKEDVEARATIKFIDKFLDSLGSELDLCKVAKERFLNKKPKAE